MDRYIELVFDDVSHRPGAITKVSDYKSVKVDRVVYTTMFNFDDYILQYWEISKKKFGYSTIKEYDGDVYMPYLWIDIDDKKDLNNAVSICRFVIEKMHLNYGIEYESMVIFFSGGKGFHIGIHSSIFNAQDFKSKNLKDIVRNMVTEILGGKHTVDFSIYDTTRVFRAPFSKHNTSGRYKVDIDYNLILEGNLTKILELADTCTRELSYKYKFKYSELFEKLFIDSIKKIEEEKENVDILVSKEDLMDNESIFKVPTVGNRNFDLFRQAFRLFSVKELKVNEVTDLMKFIYYSTNEIALKNKDEQISASEFKKLVKSAFDRCRSLNTSKFSAMKVSSLALSAFKKISNSKYVNAIVEEFNNDLRGGLVVGNLYPCIGREGTAKSIYCQEVAVVNALDFDIPSIYINAEMSEIALFDRVYLRMFQKSFIGLIQNGTIKESDIVEIEYKIYEAFKDNFQISSHVDLESKDILDIVRRKEDEIKKKILLVTMDSMNSMKMHGESEALTAFQNTKYLKEACKNGGFAGLLINHVTQGCPYTLRDVAEYVRGGSKVLQNADAHLSFSKIVDKQKSNFKSKPQDIIYQPNQFYIRLVNKRDTGRTLDKVVTVTDTLSFELSDSAPQSFEYYDG